MLEEEVEQLGVFYRMPGNWDGHGANSIGFDAILRSVELMTMVFCEYGRKPYFLAPTHTGGISVEYQYKGAKIEIEVNDSFNHYSYLIDLGEMQNNDDERYYIETDVEISTLIYRIGQIIGTYEEEGKEEIDWMERDRIAELQALEDPIHPKKIWVTQNDYKLILDEIDNPREASESLKKAYRSYREMVDNGSLVTDVLSPGEFKKIFYGKDSSNVDED